MCEAIHMQKPQTDAEKQLLFALVRMCEQYLTIPKEARDRPLELEHKFMSAGEEAIGLLADYGLVDRRHGGGNWSETAVAYRFPLGSKA
jgi:hypothetical protein